MATSFVTPVNQVYDYKPQLPLQLMSQVAGSKQQRFDMGLGQAQNALNKFAASIPADVGYDTQRRNEVIKRVQEQLNNLGTMDYSSPEAQAKVNSIIGNAMQDGNLQEIVGNYYYARQLEDEMEQKRQKGEEINPYNMTAYEQLQSYRNQAPGQQSQRLGRGRIYSNYDTSKFATDIGSKVQADLEKQMQGNGLYNTTQLKEVLTREKVADAIMGAAQQDSRVMGELGRKFSYETQDQNVNDLFGQYSSSRLSQINDTLKQLEDQRRENPKAAAFIDPEIEKLKQSQKQWQVMGELDQRGNLSEGQKQQMLFQEYLRGYANDFGQVFAKDRRENTFEDKGSVLAQQDAYARRRDDIKYARKKADEKDKQEQNALPFGDNAMPGWNETRDVTGFTSEGEIKLDENGEVAMPSEFSFGLETQTPKLTDNPWDLLPFNVRGSQNKPDEKEKQEGLIQDFIMSNPTLKQQWMENPANHGRIRQQVVPIINESLKNYGNSFNQIIPVNRKDTKSSDYYDRMGKDIVKSVGVTTARVFRMDEETGKMVELSAKEKQALNQLAQDKQVNPVYLGKYGARNTLGIGVGDALNVGGINYVIEDNRKAETTYLQPAAYVYRQQFNKQDNAPVFSGMSNGGRPIYYQKIKAGLTYNPNTGGAAPYAQYQMGTLINGKFVPTDDRIFRPEDIEQIQTTLYQQQAGRNVTYKPSRGTGEYDGGYFGTDDSEDNK